MTVNTEEHGVVAEVRAHMARRRMSGRALSKDLGLTYSALRRRLLGEVDFRTGELTQIADIFGIPVTDLFPPAPAKNDDAAPSSVEEAASS